MGAAVVDLRRRVRGGQPDPPGRDHRHAVRDPTVDPCRLVGSHGAPGDRGHQQRRRPARTTNRRHSATPADAARSDLAAAPSGTSAREQPSAQGTERAEGGHMNQQLQAPPETTAKWAPWWVYFVIIVGANYLRRATSPERQHSRSATRRRARLLRCALRHRHPHLPRCRPSVTYLLSVWVIDWPGGSWGRRAGVRAVAASVAFALILLATMMRGLAQIWRALSGPANRRPHRTCRECAPITASRHGQSCFSVLLARDDCDAVDLDAVARQRSRRRWCESVAARRRRARTRCSREAGRRGSATNTPHRTTSLERGAGVLQDRFDVLEHGLDLCLDRRLRRVGRRATGSVRTRRSGRRGRRCRVRRGVRRTRHG